MHDPDNIVREEAVDNYRTTTDLEDGYYAHTFLTQVHYKHLGDQNFRLVLIQEMQEVIYHIYRLKKCWVEFTADRDARGEESLHELGLYELDNAGALGRFKKEYDGYLQQA
jgi:hypothetical protein